MKLMIRLALTVSLFLAIALANLGAQSLVMKIASPVPENTDYGRVLNLINAEWIKLSGGKVRMQLIHGGAAGGEDEVFRKMKLGTIQGGLFTSVGLGRISLPVITMSAPLLIKSDGQMKYVLSQMRGELDQSFKDKGFQAITYARGGWVYMFSKEPFQIPADIKKRKLAINDTDKAFFQAFQTLNYSPISVSFNEYITALNSGLIDSFLSSPLIAAQSQWFGIGKNMLDLPIAPFIGGLLIDDRAWNRVPADLRQALIDSANNIVNKVLEPAVEKLEIEAISVMKKNGLNLIPASAQIRTIWAQDFDIGVKQLLSNGGVDKPAFERIKGMLATFKE